MLNTSRRGLAFLGLAIVAISTAAPFVHWAAPMNAVAIAALRVSIAALVLLAISPRALSQWWALPSRERNLVALSGALFGLHLGVWIASLSFTSTAASLALVATNPIFAAIIGRGWLGDRVGARAWLGIAIAAFGCVVLAGGDWQAGGAALAGDGLALLGAAAAAGYLVVGRRVRDAMPLGAYLAVVNVIAAVGLLIVARGAVIAPWPAHSYLAVLGAAVVASLGGHTLLNAAVRTTPAHLVALTILGEPIGASLLSWAIFADRPTAAALVGGAIVLVGIAMGFISTTREIVTP